MFTLPDFRAATITNCCEDCKHFYPLPRSIITDNEGEVMGGNCKLHDCITDSLQECEDWEQKND